MSRPERLCPSAAAAPEAIVLGIRRADGTIGYLSGRLAATEEFVAAVHDRAATDFRFAAPCAEGGCGHWRAGPAGDAGERSAEPGRCSLIGRLRSAVGDQFQAVELPRCGIRSSCRWFAQDGSEACRICPVVTRASGAHAPAEPPHEGERT